MRRESRAQNLQAMKDRRMKRIAAGGAVLLAVVLAYEVSHMLKSSGGSNPSAAATTTTTTATSTPASPASTPTGTAAAAVLPTAGSGRLPNSDPAPNRSKSQLYSFSHFAGKDPFTQQISSGTTSGTSTSGGGSAPNTPTAVVASSVSSAAQQSSSRSLAKIGPVSISVNGRVQTVRVGASFPSSNPLFTLVSASRGAARIGIANGSYASGAQTITLTVGKTVTLVDTADGVSYKLQLVSAS
jgi:hypothetical protein